MARKQWNVVATMALVVCIVRKALCTIQLSHFTVLNDVTLQQVLTSSKCVSTLCSLGCFAECESYQGCNAFSLSSQTDAVCYLHHVDSSSASITSVGISLYMPECKTGWYPYGNKCYLFNEPYESWYNAQTTCESMGASLIKIETTEENDFVKDKATGHTPDHYWIGGRYFAEYDEQRWADETELTFTDFSEVPGSGCMDIVRGLGFGWNVYWDCDYDMSSICEKELSIY